MNSEETEKNLPQPPTEKEIDDQVSEDAEEIVGNNLIGNGDFDVFVSYRVTPDQYIAQALKTLICTSIEPTPNVFVSGKGGLRPSATGFKSQIQKAIQTSKVVIGVITEHSKQREWIFYEAGAAFGMGRIYAPVVFDVGLSDLPTSIADYQATEYLNEEALLGLITRISEELGGELRRSFNKRHKRFVRSVQEGRGGVNGQENVRKPDAVEALLNEIKELIKSGKRFLAHEKREEIIALCDTSEHESKKQNILIRLALIFAEPGREVEALEELPDDLKHLSNYHLYLYLNMATFRPQRADLHLQKFLEISGHDTSDAEAETRKIIAHVDLGQIAAASVMVKSMLSSNKQESIRIVSQIVAEEKIPGVSFAECLLCSVRGLLSREIDLLESIAKIAFGNRMYILAAYCYSLIIDKPENGHVLHSYGLCLRALGLNSLAYEAFNSAERAGVTISVATKASLFGSGKVAAHGVKILSEHQAGFPDAASQAFPFGVRRDLEAQVESEVTSLESIKKSAKKFLLSLAEYADKIFIEDKGDPILADHGLRLGVQSYKTDGLVTSLSLLSNEYKAIRTGLILNNTYFNSDVDTFIILRYTPLLANYFHAKWNEKEITHMIDSSIITNFNT
jgi:hypothetical protein